MPPRGSLNLMILPPTLRWTLLSQRFSPSILASGTQSQLQWRRYSLQPAPKAIPATQNESKAVGEHIEVPRPSNSKWLGEMKSRVGKCITFGLSPSQIRDAASIAKILSKEWRKLVAGREGFLTGKRRAGLLRHQVVWGEMDSMAHVNNVTYTRYAESARLQWAQKFALHIDQANSERWQQLWTPYGQGLILRSIKTEYKFPMVWPDRVSVFHKLRKPVEEGDEGFWLDVVIVSEGKQRVTARCEEDIVVYDYVKGKKGGVESWMAGAFQTIWEEQEAERERVGKMVGEVEGLVRGLEMVTWDREGAVENMGS